MSEEVSERIRANRFNIMVIETYNRVKNLTAEAEPDDKKGPQRVPVFVCRPCEAVNLLVDSVLVIVY